MKAILTLIIFLLFSFNSRSQTIAKIVLNKYPKSLVVNVYNDVISKIKLSDSLQYQLVKFYAQKDSLIISALSKNFNPNYVSKYSDSLAYNIEIKFKKLLSVSEKREYFTNVERARLVNYPILHDTIYMDIQMDSQFGLALALFDKFNLKPKQKDSLIYYSTLLKKKEDYAKANPDSGYFDKAFFESDNMPKCLTELEYNGLLSIKNKAVAEAYAKHTWYTLNYEKILGKMDVKTTRDLILYDLKLYYLTKATIYDKMANRPEIRDVAINQVAMPIILQKALEIKNKTAKSLEKYSW